MACIVFAHTPHEESEDAMRSASDEPHSWAAAVETFMTALAHVG